MTSTSDAQPALRTQGLGHRYPKSRAKPRRRRVDDTESATFDRPALDNLTLTVAVGEVFGVLGPNGCGKSTLFRILSTALRPTTGRAFILENDVVAQAHAARRALGVVFQSPSLDLKLTARENLLHHGQLQGLTGPTLHDRAEALLERFSLRNRGHELVERFSGGMRRKVELARALLHQPRVLLMDEPDTGLDVGARADLWRQLRALRSESNLTIALTTHLMDEAEHCDRLAILNEGKLVALDTPGNLKRRIGGDVVTVEPVHAALEQSTHLGVHLLSEMIRERFAPWPAGGEPRVVETRIRMERPDGAAFVPLLATSFPDRIASLSVGQPTLDDVFLHLTGQALNRD